MFELYNPEYHLKSLEYICNKWNSIFEIINEELPSSDFITGILKKIEAPVSSDEIGIDSSTNPLTFRMTKDIRDKYILSALMFDTGVLDNFAEKAYN